MLPGLINKDGSVLAAGSAAVNGDRGCCCRCHRRGSSDGLPTVELPTVELPTVELPTVLS
jgi:hypothetical protein